MCVCVCVRAQIELFVCLFFVVTARCVVVLVFGRRKFADEIAGAALAIVYWRTVRNQFSGLYTLRTE